MSMVQAAGGVMGWGIIIQHILGQNLPSGVSGVNVFFNSNSTNIRVGSCSL